MKSESACLLYKCLLLLQKHLMLLKIGNREYSHSVFWYQVYQARLSEGLLTSQGLLSNSTCILEDQPGKLDIKRREPGILCISLPSWFTLQTSEYDVMINFWVESASLATPFKKCNVIMTCTCREIDNVCQAMCNNAVNMNGNWYNPLLYVHTSSCMVVKVRIKSFTC